MSLTTRSNLQYLTLPKHLPFCAAASGSYRPAQMAHHVLTDAWTACPLMHRQGPSPTLTFNAEQACHPDWL